MLTLADIERMTREDGEGWGYAHVRRVLKLAAAIGADLDYDHEAFDWAVHLHDWGAFPRYRQPGVDHALRSRQIAECDILPQTALSARQAALILDAIEKHDYRDERPVETAEALVLREADFLDFLGVIGMAREFAWGPNNLQTCYERILARRNAVRARFTLPVAQQIAVQRLETMQWALERLLEESFGDL
ncbi:MAG: HD domain-containing protein [Anaerolineae bacterium]|nr:HD domain-containing protein [Anaerolineae bacterium]